MKIWLKEVNPKDNVELMHLYKLLGERKPYQSISHKKMPLFGEHCAFVQSKPYKGWYLIWAGDEVVGTTYITHQNELGIFIYAKDKGKGYGKKAIELMMGLYEGPFLANINPENAASVSFFTALGFTQLQVTYTHD